MADLHSREDRKSLERQASPQKLRGLGNRGVRSSQYRRTDSKETLQRKMLIPKGG